MSWAINHSSYPVSHHNNRKKEGEHEVRPYVVWLRAALEGEHEVRPYVAWLRAALEGEHEVRPYIAWPRAAQEGKHEVRPYVAWLRAALEGEHEVRPYVAWPRAAPTEGEALPSSDRTVDAVWHCFAPTMFRAAQRSPVIVNRKS